MGRDLRKYAQQTNTRLIIGSVLVLFLVGDGLIYLIYGPSAALTGLLCLGVGLSPILLIILAMSVIEWIVRRSNRE